MTSYVILYSERIWTIYGDVWPDNTVDTTISITIYFYLVSSSDSL